MHGIRQTLDQGQTECYLFPKDPFCYLKIQGDIAVGPFQVRNISKGGATLVLTPELIRETILAVQLYNKVRRCWSEHEIQIEYVFRTPCKFTVGIIFTRHLGHDELQGFL